MAFDLMGKAPEHYDGEWIRFNIWTWHRIWRSVIELFPEHQDSISLWYVNSNEFIDKETCLRLSEAIERYGEERFALHASHLDLPVQQTHIGYQTIYMALVFEMPYFIKFLKSCGGFYLK